MSEWPWLDKLTRDELVALYQAEVRLRHDVEYELALGLKFEFSGFDTPILGDDNVLSMAKKLVLELK